MMVNRCDDPAVGEGEGKIAVGQMLENPADDRGEDGGFFREKFDGIGLIAMGEGGGVDRDFGQSRGEPIGVAEFQFISPMAHGHEPCRAADGVPGGLGESGEIFRVRRRDRFCEWPGRRADRGIGRADPADRVCGDRRVEAEGAAVVIEAAHAAVAQMVQHGGIFDNPRHKDF